MKVVDFPDFFIIYKLIVQTKGKLDGKITVIRMMREVTFTIQCSFSVDSNVQFNRSTSYAVVMCK